MESMVGEDRRPRRGDSVFEKNLALLDLYSGRRCLVTGHTGFKGAWLCRWLKMLGVELTGYALDPPTEPNLFHLAGVGEIVNDLRGDIRDFETLRRTVDGLGPEIVFHLAAQSIVRVSYDEPKSTFDINVGGLVNLLEALRHSPTVKAIVVITSDKCYENREWTYSYRETDHLGGRDPYSASKAGAEIVCAAYERSFFEAKSVTLASCRAGNVIGGGDWARDRIIPDTVRALSSGRTIEVRNPRAVRPWQHVLDALFGYLLLGAGMIAGPENAPGPPALQGPWNFGPPLDSCRPVHELVETFIEAHGSGSWKDVSPGQVGAPHEAGFLALSWDKAHRHLGWHPRWDFKESVQRAGRWYREQAAGTDAALLCENDIQAFTGGR
jgi:CDP-glucose 4,6-dehydratase